MNIEVRFPISMVSLEFLLITFLQVYTASPVTIQSVR